MKHDQRRPSNGDPAATNADDGVAGAALYLMCDDLGSTMKPLETTALELH
jgi:hypothetical protein